MKTFNQVCRELALKLKGEEPYPDVKAEYYAGYFTVETEFKDEDGRVRFEYTNFFEYEAERSFPLLQLLGRGDAGVPEKVSLSGESIRFATESEVVRVLVDKDEDVVIVLYHNPEADVRASWSKFKNDYYYNDTPNEGAAKERIKYWVERFESWRRRLDVNKHKEIWLKR